MHWHADYILLWQGPVGQPELLQALHHYSNAIGVWSDKYMTVLLSIGTLQTMVLLFQIFVGKETNWLFDGASLCTLPAH